MGISLYIIPIFVERLNEYYRMKHWWKILGAVLVLYALIAGLLIPLKPGILEVAPERTQWGNTISLQIKAYNSHFQEAKELKAWLKLDSTHFVPTSHIKVLSNTRLTADFRLPIHQMEEQSKELTLILDNEIDGYSLLPGAIQVTLSDSTISRGFLWSNDLGRIHEPQGLTFPYRNILYETIRNLFYHVPLWFAMLILLFISMIYSGLYLKSMNTKYDHAALALTQIGILYGILGLITGAIWARWTWGDWWSFDVKQNMSAIAMLIYLAYFVLRSSFEDDEVKARVSSVYNIFAFTTLIPLLFVIPRLYDSLHPGNGGNPGLGGEDLDNTMRMVFYPAIIGFTLLGAWLANLAYRYLRLEEKHLEE